MRDFKLTASHDLAFENEDFVIVEDGTEVAQNCTIRLRTRQGEFKMDLTAGVDYDELFSASTSMAHKEALLRKVVYETTGVSQIHKFDLVMDNESGTLYIDMNVSTTFADNEILTLTL